ncbi:SOS response-associated peptidase family protein [Nitrosomonas ureae]|uniref:SOS response-associated peptidase family protein n=1 Tax=Nitrosomonas ureae TaxID=44577 RepID=UPI000BE24A4B
MRWGFIPKWASDSKKIHLFNNVRAETVATKPIFKKAFRTHRCIIPATGFYEWKRSSGDQNEQPYYI